MLRLTKSSITRQWSHKKLHSLRLFSTAENIVTTNPTESDTKDEQTDLTIADVLKQRELLYEQKNTSYFETWERICSSQFVHEAVSTMVKNKVGALIVTSKESNNNDVVGIVTERDVLTKVDPTTGPLDKTLTVSSIMSPHIMCINASTPAMDALASMSKKKFRHFAVIHEESKYQNEGSDITSVPADAMRCVLSLRDILKTSSFDSIGSSAITAESMLRQKHLKMNMILNTRVDDEISTADAVVEMAKHNIGSVIVLDESHLIKGIFTERDYLMIVHEGLDPQNVKVNDVCSKKIFCLEPETSLKECVSSAALKHFRHFPVKDPKTSEVRGVLSIKDIAKAISKGHDDSPGFWLMELFKSKMPVATSTSISEPEKATTA